MNRFIRAIALAAAIFASGSPGAVLGQAFPVKPVRLMVPFPPGGATDIIGRLVAGKMQEVWGQSVIVESKPGAGTVVGTDYVAKSSPDGYTVVGEVSPEAAERGPLALVENGDTISADVEKRLVDLDVPEGELAARRERARGFGRSEERSWLSQYQRTVQPLPKGAVLLKPA